MLFRQHPIRAYADTTVFGGIVDVEFEAASRAFFEEDQKREVRARDCGASGRRNFHCAA